MVKWGMPKGQLLLLTTLAVYHEPVCVLSHIVSVVNTLFPAVI